MCEQSHGSVRANGTFGGKQKASAADAVVGRAMPGPGRLWVLGCGTWAFPVGHVQLKVLSKGEGE